MKKIPLFLALMMLLMVSCTKDDSLTKDGRETIKMSFSLRTAEPTVEGASTRSTDTLSVDDSGVENLWALQFENGVFIQKDYLMSVNLSSFMLDLVPNASGQTSNIYFVANVGASAFATAPASEAAFQAQTGAIVSEAACLLTGTTKKFVPMSGRLKNIEVKREGNICSSVLYRLLARIDYTYSVDPTLSFVVKKVRLCNVSNAIQYDSVITAKYPADGATTQTFTYEVAPNATTAAPKTLTFYVPDNRRGEGANTAKTDAKLKIGVTGATYIELVGYSTGINGGDEITYTLYPGADAYNDYNISRNTIYKMSTNIVGISTLTDARFKKAATSNCYIVAPNASVSIPVSRANKSALGTQLADVTSGWSASIYWQTAAGLITVSDADKSGGCFTVTAGAATGNAVVVVKNASSDIVWSWHIWVTGYNPTAENETNNGFVWMSRNLGATALADGTATTFATCGGLMYQRGRKDPFVGTDGSTTVSPYKALPIYDASGTLMTNVSTSLTWPTDGTPTGTASFATTGDVVKMAILGTTAGSQIPYASQLSYSVKYPLLHLFGWAGSTATSTPAQTIVGGMSSWGGEYGEGKSVYDPCPQGWRVPSGRKVSNTFVSPWSTWTTTQNFTASTFAALKWKTANVYFYPAAGIRVYSSGALYNVGTYGSCWGASPNGADGYNLGFSSGFVLPSNPNNRAGGCRVRCVQE